MLLNQFPKADVFKSVDFPAEIHYTDLEITKGILVFSYTFLHINVLLRSKCSLCSIK